MTQKELMKLSLLAEIAGCYYERGLNQNEIADRLCISRTRVSRLLKEAQEKGIVSFCINYHYERHYILEDHLKSRYSLKEVRILNNRNFLQDFDASTIQNAVASLAASYLMEQLHPEMIIGTSWGAMLAKVVHHLQPVSIPIQVVQLIGSVPCRVPEHTPQAVVANLSTLFQCPGRFLNLPLFIEDDYVRNAMLKDANNKHILNIGMFSDMVLTGISDMTSIHAQHDWLGYLTADLYQELLQKGAVGAICARFFDRNGNEVDCRWNRSCVGISFSRLRSVPNVVVIASGTNKVPALTYALNNNLVDTLITDGSTATAILGIRPYAGLDILS